MEKIKIITDSTCDLPKDIIEKFDIDVIPVYLNINSQSYRDGLDITFEELNEIILKTDSFPTISSINPDIFKDIYESYLDKGYKIISIHVSSKLSLTYQSASIAKNILDTNDVIIYDSANVCAGLGMIVQKAASMVKDGYSLNQICDNIESSFLNIKSRIIINNLEALSRSGKITKTMGMLGNIFKIRPIVELSNGEVILVGGVRGSKKVINYLINFIEENDIDDNTEMCLIYLDDCNLFDDLKKYLRDRDYKYSTIKVGCVCGTYIGNKGIGIFINKIERG